MEFVCLFVVDILSISKSESLISITRENNSLHTGTPHMYLHNKELLFITVSVMFGDHIQISICISVVDASFH
jgi:hypothetical protein